MESSIRGKRKNHRKYPGARGRRPDNYRQFRKPEALERQAAYDQLSITDKISLLDVRLGKGLGAVKQRARLALLLEKQNKPQPEVSKASAESDKKFQKKSK